MTSQTFGSILLRHQQWSETFHREGRKSYIKLSFSTFNFPAIAEFVFKMETRIASLLICRVKSILYCFAESCSNYNSRNKIFYNNNYNNNKRNNNYNGIGDSLSPLMFILIICCNCSNATKDESSIQICKGHEAHNHLHCPWTI